MAWHGIIASISLLAYAAVVACGFIPFLVGYLVGLWLLVGTSFWSIQMLREDMVCFRYDDSSTVDMYRARVNSMYSFFVKQKSVACICFFLRFPTLCHIHFVGAD